jgi:AraC-like DNA-binding protein
LQNSKLIVLGHRKVKFCTTQENISSIAAVLGFKSYSSFISLAIVPVITIETVLFAIARLVKATSVPIPFVLTSYF